VDALTNDRVYRPAWSRTKAREYLLDRAGKLFDPSLVPEFIKLLDAGEIS